MKYQRMLLLVMFAHRVSVGVVEAQLHAGDVAVVAFNTCGTDEFAWVSLRTIPAYTTINFTDSSVSNGWFRWTEHLGDSVARPGPLRWSHTNALPVGSVVTWKSGSITNWSLGQASGGRMNLSEEGDQIIAYVGDIANNGPAESPWRGDPCAATMVYALNFANSGWGLIPNRDTSTSMIPPGLSTSNATAVHVDRRSNGYYYGPLAGTAEELRNAIANPSNWVSGSAPFSPTGWAESFSVSNRWNGTSFTMR